MLFIAPYMMYSTDMEFSQWHRRSQLLTFRLNSLLTGLVGISLLAWFFNTIPPKEGSIIFLGIVLASSVTFFLLASFIKNVRRCFAWSSGVGVLLLLRAAKLHDPLYIILLIALLGSLELAFKNR